MYNYAGTRTPAISSELGTLYAEALRAKQSRGVGMAPAPPGIGPQFSFGGDITPDIASALRDKMDATELTPEEVASAGIPAFEPSDELLREATEADLAGAGAQEPAGLDAGTYSQISSPLARELQSRISQPVTGQATVSPQPGARPGFFSRLGGGLKAALGEGLTAVKLGPQGYKALQLQKELLPLRKSEYEAEMARKLGYERELSPIQEALQRSLITHRAGEEARFAIPKTISPREQAETAFVGKTATPEQQRLIGVEAKIPQTPEEAQQAQLKVASDKANYTKTIINQFGNKAIYPNAYDAQLAFTKDIDAYKKMGFSSAEIDQMWDMINAAYK